MNPFLSDYIFALPSKSKEKVQNILMAAQSSKEDLDGIAERLNDIQERAPIVIAPEAYGSIITSVGLDSAHRDVDTRMIEIFQESNAISLLLDTHTEVLSSDFKKYQDQLLAFEKYVDNYTFMLADQSFYDHGYSESFSDSLQKETGSTLSQMLYDRSTVAFDPGLEILDVDQGAGVLTMSAGFISSYPLYPSVLRSNCLQYITSDTGIEKSVSESVGEGWRSAISSPRPIASSITEGQDKGAQFELEYALDPPAPCDTFSITPMADTTMDLLSVKVYGEDLSTYKELLTETKTLNKNTILYFENDIVSKIVVVVNQPLYTRGKQPPTHSELRYKEILQKQRSRPSASVPSKINARKAFNRLFTKWFLASEKKRAALRRPVANIDKYSVERGSAKRELSYRKENARIRSLFKRPDRSKNVFSQWIISKLFRNQPELLERYTLEDKSFKKRVAETPYILEDQELKTSVDPMNYEYVLGIRHVKAGITVDKNRGLFISKPVPSPVQSGEVRIQVDDKNYRYITSFLDNPQITTIEYSITNKSNPSSEKDWVPILPSGLKGEKYQERLFLQSSGYGAFRFRAVRDTGVEIFKNGYRMDLGDTAFVASNDNLALIGVRIPQSEFSLNADDVYTVEYVPIGDPTTVNFSEKGFQQKNIASAYDSNGAGEFFGATGNSNTVHLSNHPIVDTNKISKESSYSTTFGLVGTYQPIKVVLQDGTIAYNYTNYTGLQQNTLDPTDSNYAFYHSGRQIIFNKRIDQGFRVYYQYEPSYLRYRIIFRLNGQFNQNKVSPFVNSLTVKMKMNASILGMNNKKV